MHDTCNNFGRNNQSIILRNFYAECSGKIVQENYHLACHLFLPALRSSKEYHEILFSTSSLEIPKVAKNEK